MATILLVDDRPLNLELLDTICHCRYRFLSNPSDAGAG